MRFSWVNAVSYQVLYAWCKQFSISSLIYFIQFDYIFYLQICSTSKDGQLLLWNVEDGTKIAELKWASTPSIKYKHKACR